MPLRERPSPGSARGRPSSKWAQLSEALEEPLRRFHAWKSQHQYLGRYSVEKLCALHHYQETTSLWRVASVILMTPLPPFLVLLAMDIVPMNDPRAGPAKNSVAFARSVIAHALLPSMILLSTKQALQLSDRYYSIAKIFRVGVCVSVALEFICISAAFLWRFPVPFREVTAIPLFVVFVALFNWIFGKEDLRRKFPKLKHYLPMVTMQLSMYYSFLCLAVAFAYFSSATQIVLVLTFPVVKLAVKKAVWSQARKLDDLSTDVTICFVELTGALYQTVCLQFAKSQALQYVILFSDLFQALYEVRVYVFHEYITDGVSTVQTAVRIVLSSVYQGIDERPLANKQQTSDTLLPNFLTASGSGTSVFVKPKMVKAFHSKRLLDLSRYKYEIELASAESKPDQPRLPQSQGVLPAPRCSVIDTRRSDFTGGRRRSLDSTAMSIRSAKSSPRSHYQRQSAQPSGSSYGISVASAASSELSSTAVSPPDEPAPPSPATAPESATAQAGRGPAHRPTKLPPIRRASSYLASLSHISLDSSQTLKASPTMPIFSVYDPLPTAAVARPSVTRTNSLVNSLVSAQGNSTDHPPIARRSSASKLQSRNSKRGSLVHPGTFDVETLPENVVDPESPPKSSPSDKVASCLSHASDKDEGMRRITRVMIDGIQLPRKDQARILEQTLQLLFSCEVLVVVEFLEVLLPALYGLVVGGLWPLYNARYNLLFISMSHSQMLSTVSGSLAYAGLESLSLAVMVFVMKKRYGISALHMLAFVLEKYWKVLYGKLLGSFIVIWLTLTVHQGVDFTFTYDYGTVLERFGSSRWN